MASDFCLPPFRIFENRQGSFAETEIDDGLIAQRPLALFSTSIFPYEFLAGMCSLTSSDH